MSQLIFESKVIEQNIETVSRKKSNKPLWVFICLLLFPLDLFVFTQISVFGISSVAFDILKNSEMDFSILAFPHMCLA